MSKINKADRFIRPKIDPSKLQHFLAVYNQGNFRVAAEQSNVTQQAVSKSIARLEKQLGLPLFKRTPQGTSPSDYAHVLARHAKIIISETRLAADELMAMRGAYAGYVQIGIGWSFAPRLGPLALQRFKLKHPDVGLRIVGGTSATIYPQMISGELDFAVSAPPYENTMDASLSAETLFHEQDVIVVGNEHPLAGKDEVRFRDLSSYPWIMDLTIPSRWHAICEAFVKHGSKPPSEVLDMNSLALAKAVIKQGTYVCLLSEELVAPERETGIFNTFKLAELPVERPALLVTRNGVRLQPAAIALRDIFIDVCHEYYPPKDNTD